MRIISNRVLRRMRKICGLCYWIVAGADVQMGASGDVLEVKARLTGIPALDIWRGVSDDEEHPGLPWKAVLEVLLGASGTVYLGVAWWGVPWNTSELSVWMIDEENLDSKEDWGRNINTHMWGSIHMQVRELHIDAVMLWPTFWPRPVTKDWLCQQFRGATMLIVPQHSY